MNTGVSRLLYWGAQSRGPCGRRDCCGAGARLELPTSPPASHHEGNILVFAYTSLCLSTGRGQWGKPPKPTEHGPCQPAPLPPCIPELSLFQVTGI